MCKPCDFHWKHKPQATYKANRQHGSQQAACQTNDGRFSQILKQYRGPRTSKCAPHSDIAGATQESRQQEANGIDRANHQKTERDHE